MLEFAKNEFELSKPEKDGKTLRSHLEAVERATRKPMERLHKECPAHLVYLWHWFIDLSNARVPGEPIGYKDIVAWQEITGITLTPWEAEVIRSLDISYLRPE